MTVGYDGACLVSWLLWHAFEVYTGWLLLQKGSREKLLSILKYACERGVAPECTWKGRGAVREELRPGARGRDEERGAHRGRQGCEIHITVQGPGCVVRDADVFTLNAAHDSEQHPFGTLFAGIHTKRRVHA
jgi:hypothetical protein